MKTAPWAQNGNIAWVTMAGSDAPNPETGWYSIGKIVVKPTGGTVTTLPTDNVGDPRPIASGIVASWVDPGTHRAWIVLLDWPQASEP